MTDESPRDIWSSKQREDKRAESTAYTLEELEKRFRRFVIQMLTVVSIIGVLSTIALFAFGVILRDQDQTDLQLEQFTRDIQSQRYDSSFANCFLLNELKVPIREVLKGSDVDPSLITKFDPTNCATIAGNTVRDMALPNKKVGG